MTLTLTIVRMSTSFGVRDPKSHQVPLWVPQAKSIVLLAVFRIFSNLYDASMLATLNNRPFTQQHILDDHGTVVHLNSLASSQQQLKSNKRRPYAYGRFAVDREPLLSVIV
ncbi:hypothetical protein PLEOSDRAFT_1086937 [Pleurotus ostreatus PC15]|uniref:Uncharacterized protein n=1 Tax=Pleurotus ostreatus (strain PC15) TaxID=1137138 RepID=A0A067N5G9_PLEO1|nr:hypothetical protein PLEOSDRAFT_1086937 [Pleurotus ostreatus PC15]